MLFYGIMFADMGYAIIMMLVGLTVLKKTRPKGGMRTFFELMFECGITTFIMGFLTGSFFGNAVPTVIRIFNPDSTFDLWSLFSPLNDTVFVLIGAMILGSIQILTGMVTNLVMQAKDGHIMEGILTNVPWWLFFAGVGVGAITGAWWLLIVAIITLVCTQGRSQKSISGKLFSGLGSLYNVTAYLGDVLSYSRLMALMLAGSVIGQVFNTLAALPGNIYFFIVFFLIGQTLNFAMSLLGCFVHDMRLQFLEFFGKFYKGRRKAI